MWLSAIILGLLSSSHCLGMCAPLQAVFIGRFIKKKEYFGLFLFHLSRIFTYGILGLLAGFLGRGLKIQEWQQNTSLIGGLLLLFAFLLFYVIKLDRKLFAVLMPYIHRLKGRLEKDKSSRSMYYLGSGALNGILPCAMVYLAILPAAAMPNLLFTFGYMLLFGLGTMPLLVLSYLSISSFAQKQFRLIQKLSPAIILITAGLLILRGMDLGIPYLSPESQIISESSATNVCQ